MSNGQLKHEAAIYSVFEMMFESWMNEDDKREFIDLLLQRTGTTLSELDEAIEQGVKKGHSVEEQLTIVRLLVGHKG
ncbi:hypothetical protein [Vibrio parahaemolyticus]|uniref:hypothetical protein n=1 Tax=Vibrio parahaemolyticus TaxID=670 RepID=UPI0004E6EA56|nr:hypothetical protein [Vibrio parahaemolyticus]KFE94914.1 hypothetical protein HB39_12505 [Vibrio parahaemolyticus]MBX5338943.1 hypothetical protein [Vibrio parahaemolyticus]